MTDLLTMVRKETLEFISNKRSLRIFALAVLLLGILPMILSHSKANPSVIMLLSTIYVLVASAVVTAQTAPDMVLHERIGHTLDYLLTTRLSTRAIFGAKVLVSTAIGYFAAMIALAIQLVTATFQSGTGWHWLALSNSAGRIVVLGITADLSLYAAVVGTFVALRVGEQRAAYMVTVFAVALLSVPFFVGWLHLSFTTAWMAGFFAGFGTFSILLCLLGFLLFRRDMLVLYLQE
jgi:hypothetical protein